MHSYSFGKGFLFCKTQSLPPQGAGERGNVGGAVKTRMLIGVPANRKHEEMLLADLLLLCIFTVHYVNPVDVRCSNEVFGRACSLTTAPEVSVVLDGQLLVGTADAVQVFRVRYVGFMEHIHAISMVVDPKDLEECTGNGPGQLFLLAQHCRNHVLNIQAFPNVRNNTVIMCGSNGYFPRCTLHQRTNLVNFTRLSSASVSDAGFSPPSNSPSVPVISLFAFNGRFFSATRFDGFSTVQSMRMAPRALLGDTSFTVRTPALDTGWLNNPNFVFGLERGEHVYFLLTENADEVTDDDTTVRYTRAMRVCLSDDGVGSRNPDTNFFLTFVKARVICTTGTDSSRIYYDILTSTDTIGAQRGPIIYGAFNREGRRGSAICRYSFVRGEVGSIPSVLDEDSYLLEDLPAWRRAVAPSFSCPGAPGDQRSLEHLQNYRLKFNPIPPMDEYPVFVSGSESIYNIVVEILPYRGTIQEIIYFSNQRGDVRQVVRLGDSIRSYTHTIYRPERSSPVSKIILHRNGNARSIFVSTTNLVMEIPRGQCSCYFNCFVCLDSKDTYCGWDFETSSCVNKVSRSDLPNLVQAFLASETDVVSTCGIREVDVIYPPIFPCNNSIVFTAAADSSTDTYFTTIAVSVGSVGIFLALVPTFLVGTTIWLARHRIRSV